MSRQHQRGFEQQRRLERFDYLMSKGCVRIARVFLAKRSRDHGTCTLSDSGSPSLYMEQKTGLFRRPMRTMFLPSNENCEDCEARAICETGWNSIVETFYAIYKELLIKGNRTINGKDKHRSVQFSFKSGHETRSSKDFAPFSHVS